MYNIHPYGTTACVLAIVHLDGNHRHIDGKNLVAMCQRCRFEFDRRKVKGIA